MLNLLKALLQSSLLLKLYFLVFFLNTNKFMSTLFKLVVSFYVSHLTLDTLYPFQTCHCISDAIQSKNCKVYKQIFNCEIL